MTSKDFYRKVEELRFDVQEKIASMANDYFGGKVDVGEFLEDEDVASFDYIIDGDYYRLEEVNGKTNTIVFHDDSGNRMLPVSMYDVKIDDLINVLATLEDIITLC